MRVDWHGGAVAIVVSFPRLLRVPPRFGVAPMSPEIKYLAHGLKFLSNGSPKLRLVDENPACSVPFEECSDLISILAPALMSKLDRLGIVVK